VSTSSQRSARGRYGTAAGTLTRAALQRLEDTVPWYSALPARERSWVGLVAQAGVQSFLTWLDDPSAKPLVTSQVFGTAPRELTRSVTLRQTLDLVRVVVAATEECAPALAVDPADPAEMGAIERAVLLYSREVAFSAAEVYANAAELRGTWDSRLEALVLHTLLRGESGAAVRTQLDALGWQRHPALFVLVGSGAGEPPAAVGVDALRAAARDIADDVMVGTTGDRLIALLGTADDVFAIGAALAAHCGPGPVVIGPTVASFDRIEESARAAMSGYDAAAARPHCPRPVHAEDLLPERALARDEQASATLARLHDLLYQLGSIMTDTVEAYLDSGRSLESAARQLFVHPNTVRYRLRKIAGDTGWDATIARDAYVLQVALAIGRLPRPVL
jgi:hypothetical protein